MGLTLTLFSLGVMMASLFSSETRTQVLGSSTRLELPVWATDQPLVDLQRKKVVVKPGSKAERRQTEQLGDRGWPWG